MASDLNKRISADVNFVRVLEGLGCSLLVCSKQAGGAFVIASDGIRVALRGFKAPGAMGFALNEHGAALGCGNAIWLFRAERHDGRVVLNLSGQRFVGNAAIHDVSVTLQGSIFFVNTTLSCIASISDPFDYFRISWSALRDGDRDRDRAAADRVHLNGMAVDGRGMPLFATAFLPPRAEGQWRDSLSEGIVLRLDDDTPLLRGLALPHSPQVHDNRLYLLESGAGVLHVKTLDGAHSEAAPLEVDGVLRGLALSDGYAFVGCSSIRQGSSGENFVRQRVRDRDHAGIAVIRLTDGRVCAYADLPAIREISSLHIVRTRDLQLRAPFETHPRA